MAIVDCLERLATIRGFLEPVKDGALAETQVA
jgi:hypothetical protein